MTEQPRMPTSTPALPHIYWNFGGVKDSLELCNKLSCDLLLRETCQTAKSHPSTRHRTCRKSSLLFTITASSRHPGKRPYGELDCSRASFSAHLSRNIT